MDRVASMTVFVAVVDDGSFTAAAKRMRMSPTMVGKHIRALETRLGVRLLQRTTRAQSLTEAGRLYLERCRRLLAEIEDAEREAGLTRDEPRGVLRVASTTTFATRRLVPALTKFQHAHPKVRIELELSDHRVDIVREGIDVAFRFPRQGDLGVVVRPVLRYYMAICASPEYLAGAPPLHHPRDLAAHACLSLSQWRRRESWPLQGLTTPVLTRGPLSIDNGQALREAALAHQGVIMQPEMLVEDDLASGRLARVLQGYEPEPRTLCIVYRPHTRPPAKLRRFIDFATQQWPC